MEEEKKIEETKEEEKPVEAKIESPEEKFEQSYEAIHSGNDIKLDKPTGQIIEIRTDTYVETIHVKESWLDRWIKKLVNFLLGTK